MKTKKKMNIILIAFVSVVFLILLIYSPMGVSGQIPKIKKAPKRIFLKSTGNQFTFKVPVDVRNLHPDIVKIRIALKVEDKFGKVLKWPQKDFSIIKNMFKETVVFSFNLLNVDITDTIKWTAYISFQTKYTPNGYTAYSILENKNSTKYGIDRTKPLREDDQGSVKLY